MYADELKCVCFLIHGLARFPNISKSPRCVCSSLFAEGETTSRGIVDTRGISRMYRYILRIRELYDSRGGFTMHKQRRKIYKRSESGRSEICTWRYD